jgi:cbb3-type cytochrome oxidase subunit 3
MINVLYAILVAYLSLCFVLFVLSHFAVHKKRDGREKRYDALGREY